MDVRCFFFSRSSKNHLEVIFRGWPRKKKHLTSIFVGIARQTRKKNTSRLSAPVSRKKKTPHVSWRQRCEKTPFLQVAPRDRREKKNTSRQFWAPEQCTSAKKKHLTSPGASTREKKNTSRLPAPALAKKKSPHVAGAPGP